ncbi:hypothetical protein GQ53DRAFT_888882 [Thozetella sp. PMI_491]|nr:hypothetical protein GQ53DRAFT_888882 [Thozetella sp. PMI_491]
MALFISPVFRSFTCLPCCTTEEKFLHVSYDQRWEKLKPIIVQLYMDERLSVHDVAVRMKAVYEFSANPPQYLYQFKKWGIKKRITSKEKQAVISTLAKRAFAGGSTSDLVIEQGGYAKEVDRKQLKRFMHDQIRHHSTPTIQARLFSKWSLPYDSFIANLTSQSQKSSPFGGRLSTPPFLSSIDTSGQTPFGGFPRSPSPTTQLARQNTIQRLSGLFLQGAHEELLSQITRGGPKRLSNVIAPSQLCQWSIHYCEPRGVEYLPDPIPEQQYDIEDESTWPKWQGEEQSLSDAMQERLSRNDFTSMSSEDLPLSYISVVKAIEKSPDQLRADSWAFAIMSGNIDSLRTESFDGSKHCCLNITFLAENLLEGFSIGINYIDSSGLTVLDSLMITVLRSHTTLRPPAVCAAFENQQKFPGEEKDICGRWDADSPCIRQLYAAGFPSLPQEWKHAFCHTSVQAICHSITAILGMPWSPDINTRMVVTIYLASAGFEDETLFGALACLTCMLAHNADSTLEVEISISLLLGATNCEDCDHLLLDAVELASHVPEQITESWDAKRQLGWRAFVAVLKSAKADRLKHGNRRNMDFDPESEDICYCHPLYGSELHVVGTIKNYYCGHESLGHLWAAIQTEFLTYRKISTSDASLSSRFSMQAVIEVFQDNCGWEKMPLIAQRMTKSYSTCGWFYHAGDPFCPVADEVSSHYFMNLEKWDRCQFIHSTESRPEIMRGMVN